ncbi:Zn(II)2Cys6 transcription factor [Mariannaea sp. PMI_226]|nr:Zn(II)2Cys6 transcription factor [Mariannaea sp. PMI_226]
MRVGEPRKARRTANACIPCRQSKIKCSGEDPCTNCQRRSVACEFTEGGNKVLVSVKYLDQLQKQARKIEPSPETGPSQIAATPAHHSPEVPPQIPSYLPPEGDPEPLHSIPIDPSLGCKRSSQVAFGESIDGRLQGGMTPASSTFATTELKLSPHYTTVWPSAFTITSKTIKNTHRNKRQWVWLASWSTWSFTLRLVLMLGEKLHGDSTIPPHLFADDIYTLPPKPPPNEFPHVRGLPSLDHAIYLFNTVKFHLGHTYRFFDDVEFENQMREFYAGNTVERAAEAPLWFAKFLLVLAFGTAFHSRPSSSSREPPGGRFFMRAMALIPDQTCLWKNSLLATEVLAMVGLYLFSIDERESAYVYLGQALRIAQFEGIHTQLPESELGIETVTWCRDLWWTLYIMDRHFSASVGLPMSVQDSDMTVDPPNVDSQGDSARSLQVNLSHSLSVILKTVYKPMETSLATYLEQMRSTLRTLAHHAQEIEKTTSLRLQDSADTMPKGTRHIALLYHQCVIVATRPLLLSVLKERLDMVGQCEDWDSFLAHTRAIISTGIKSAAKTLQILSGEYSLLEVFLPYDLDFTFGAALHLTMANAVFPDVVDDQGYAQLAHGILDDMISRGNRVAAVRKAELEHLEKLCQDLVNQVQRQGLQTLSLFPEDGQLVDVAHSFPPVSHMDFLDNIGISSEDFLSIVQQIGDMDSIPAGF